jgi:Flp pilus assembly protein TadB
MSQLDPSSATDTPRDPSRAPKAIAWVLGIVGVLGLAVSLVLSMGLAALFWVPTVFVAGGVMWSVWVARRHRQARENRDAGEQKDPLTATPRWPSKGVIDDRLPG